MSNVAGRPVSDILGYSLLLAIAVHGLIILGISFTPQPPSPEPARRHSLRVVMIQPKEPPPKEVEQADFLAQANQVGGGDKAEQPSTEPEVQPTPEPAPPMLVEPAPTIAKPLQAIAPKPVLKPLEPEATPPSDPEIKPKLTTRPAKTPAAPVRPKPVAKPHKTPAKIRPIPRSQPEPVAKPRRIVSAAQLFASRNQEIARLTSELERKSNAYAKLPRRKAISASTREYKYAAYMEAWRRKVVNIGNLNYPDEASRQGLYGNLILHVAVKSDGSVERIQVRKSSGHKVLDDAARRIVRLAAPFAPFPPNILSETDALDITRTWQFLRGNRLDAN